MYGFSGGASRSFNSYTGGTYRSPSTWWRDKMGKTYDDGYFTVTSKGDSASVEKFKLQRALFQLARVVNIVENSHAGEQDKALTLRWSDGSIVNHPGNAYVTLSSEDFLKQTEETLAIDSLTGQSLMLSSMKRTMDLNSFLMYHLSVVAKEKKDNSLAPDKKIAIPLFESVEVVKARESVLKDWAGFRPYFDVHRELSNTMKRPQIEGMIPEALSNPDPFCYIAGWNIMNPDDRVTFGDERLDDLLSEVESMLLDIPPTSETDFIRMAEIGSYVIRHFPSPPPGEGSGGGGAGGEGWSPPGNLTDTNLFGHAVKGDQAQDGSHQLSLNDESLKQNEPLNNLDYYPDADVPLTSLGAVRVINNDPSDYKKIAQEHRNVVKAIRNSLSFRATKVNLWSYAQEEGELDEGSLHKLAQNNPNVFAQRRVEGKPDVAISLLIDLSGSMANRDKYQEARVVAITLTEALRGLSGVHLNVLGHTADCSTGEFRAQTRKRGDVKKIQDGSKVLMAEYFTRSHSNPYGLSSIAPYDNNYDGYAIEYAAKRLMRDFPGVKNRMVIIISDGNPCNGRTHVRGSVEHTRRKLGTEVYGIGIKDAYTAAEGVEMYGNGYSIVINDVLSSLNILTPFLRKKLSKF